MSLVLLSHPVPSTPPHPSSADIATVEVLIDAVARLFPTFKHRWLVDEMKRNLPAELDFQQEAANMRRFAQLFRGTDAVATPCAVDSCSTRRLLTMTFEEGTHIHDVAAMRAAGLNPADVAALVHDTYSKQIFVDGFVHCDPHAGNVLVRPHPAHPSRPQLVMLDHGLYRELQPEFRLAYCRLWRALIMADMDAVRRECNAMGARGMPELFAAIISARTWDQIAFRSRAATRLHIADEEEHKAVVRANARAYAAEISAILNSCPRDLLLILKTNDCLRTITGGLGNSEAMWPRMARFAVQGMHHPAAASSWTAWTARWWDGALVEAQLAAHALVSAWPWRG